MAGFLGCFCKGFAQCHRINFYIFGLKKFDDIGISESICFIKIDVEGYELEVLKGAKKTLLRTKYVVVETRHNHLTFYNQYKLSDLVKLMTRNKFVLTNIITAKPFIADLCFQPSNNV